MASSSGSNCGGGGVISDPASPRSLSTTARVTDGWDNEEWGSLEEEPSEEVEEGDLTSDVCSPTLSDPTTGGINNAFDNDDDCDGGGKSSTLITNRRNNFGWSDKEFESIEELNSNHCKLDEAKKKREERKLMRQKEMEARRANKYGQTTGGPMKLGAKKM